MIEEALIASAFMLLAGAGTNSFQRVECMDRPDGSVYILESAPGKQDRLNVRIYHGWQYTEHSLPGLPIGIEEDFLNTRYDTRTAADRREAIAAFTPLERLIFNMDTVFQHEFRDCDVTSTSVRCSEEGPIRVGREWISEVAFFLVTRPGNDSDVEAIHTIGIEGKSAASGLEFSSGRRYFDYGGFSQCVYLQRDGDW